MASGDMLGRYKAFVADTKMNAYGYWVVTFSVAPGVVYPVTLCQTGISPRDAGALAASTLTYLTGQEVILP